MDAALIQTECLSPAREAVYAHYVQYQTSTGDLLTVRYQGPVEKVRAEVIQTFRKVDDGPLTKVETRVALIGEINDEGDEEPLGYRAVVHP